MFVYFIEILQEEPKSEDSLPLTLEKKWFQACMDEGQFLKINKNISVLFFYFTFAPN